MFSLEERGEFLWLTVLMKFSRISDSFILMKRVLSEIIDCRAFSMASKMTTRLVVEPKYLSRTVSWSCNNEKNNWLPIWQWDRIKSIVWATFDKRGAR